MDLNGPGFFVNYRGFLGRSMLHSAVEQEDENLVKELIQIGCDVNAEDIQSEKPIVFTDFQNPRIIEYLINNGAEVNVCDRRGNSPLHLAITKHSDENSCLESINLLLNAGTNVDTTNKKGKTALDYAVRYNFPNIVDLLLYYGANVNRENCGKSVLSLAAKAENVILFKLLLERGANVDFQNDDGSSPLHLIEWLTDCATISAVIERTGDINKRDTHSYTLLHYAARKGNAILVEMLLKGGADVSIVTRQLLHTALHVTIIRNSIVNDDVIKVLLENRANPNDRDVFDSTPFLYALTKCNIKTIKRFISHGADLRVKDSQGKSALHHAAYNSNGELIGFILDRGFDINMKNYNGKTALHIAAEFGIVSSCNILLERGAELWCKDNSGKTPLLEYVLAKRRYRRNVRAMAPYRVVALLLIVHIARLECLDVAIDQDQLLLIKVDPELRKNYESCKLAIERMKKKKIYNTLSVFDILLASKKKMSAFARNDELVTAMHQLTVIDLSEKLVVEDIYFFSMLVKFQYEVWKQRQIKKAQELISDIMNLKNPSHYVCEKIASFLEMEDLRKY